MQPNPYKMTIVHDLLLEGWARDLPPKQVIEKVKTVNVELTVKEVREKYSDFEIEMLKFYANR